MSRVTTCVCVYALFFRPYTLQQFGVFDDRKTIASHVCVERRSFLIPDILVVSATPRYFRQRLILDYLSVQKK